MMVYVNGQEISQLVLGVLTEGRWLHQPQVLSLRPEQYLFGLEKYLNQIKLELSDVGGFLLVKGPGSATSLRTSHAMVNALAFALGVQVVSLEKAPETPDSEMVIPDGLESHAFGLPTYHSDPRITPTKRDALKRKLT